jgi:hypothetical protein
LALLVPKQPVARREESGSRLPCACAH